MTRAWPAPGIDPDGTLEANARRILAVRVAEYYSYTPIVADETATEELHNLRISAKRLRYTLELFRDVFGEEGGRLIERVKAVQEDLGVLHDHDVGIGLIEHELTAVVGEQVAEFSRMLRDSAADEHQSIMTAALRPPPDDPRRGLYALLGRQHASRRESHRRFLRRWEQHSAAGLRAELARLSSPPPTPLPDAPPPLA
ncbi:MAG: CHAD domain-containing protein [Thermomicrobiales bacterium]